MVLYSINATVDLVACPPLLVDAKKMETGLEFFLASTRVEYIDQDSCVSKIKQIHFHSPILIFSCCTLNSIIKVLPSCISPKVVFPTSPLPLPN